MTCVVNSDDPLLLV